MPHIDSQRFDPLVLSPKHSTATSSNTDSSSANGVTILKYLHLMFITPASTTTPTPNRAQCFIIGPR